MRTKLLTLFAVVPVLAACDNTAGPDSPGQVAVRFQAVGSGAASSLAPSAAAIPLGSASTDHVAGANAITLVGDNGTLVIEDLRVIVSEMELERAGVECAEDLDEEECEEFEGGPFLVDVLSSTPEEIVTALVPPGSYSEFEFEVENLDFDEDDSDSERQIKESILAELRDDYPLFPSKGSIVVHGTFDGEPFTVFFDAEIEVEREFSTPFRVPEDGVILVGIDPSAWFRVGSDVLDPRPFDGQTVEFEFEFESGVEVEHDDD